ncbi:unnamed protein product [marine sediment metagenome]|uniref:Uncharacterized protein n=1 Tax=marine sediment metagenome TaxID=412755 RepID=X1KQU3_9ZZZZ
MVLQGKTWKFGDGISTDHIAPGRYLHLRSNLPELAKHVLEDASPDFAKEMNKGDFVVAGTVPTFKTTTPTSKGNPFSGTSLPRILLINIFSAP